MLSAKTVYIYICRKVLRNCKSQQIKYLFPSMLTDNKIYNKKKRNNYSIFNRKNTDD